MDSIWSYILLLTGGFIAAAISGLAGFGGGLLLLPLLTMILGPAMAVPVLTIAQLIGNASRAILGFGQIRWRPVLWFLLGAVPMSALGAFSFARIPGEIITRGIGLFIVLFAALSYFKVLNFTPGNKTMLFGGMAVGLISGLIGSAGPIGAALFLSLNLPPVAYVASEAVTAAAMHITKSIIYQRFLDTGLSAVWIGLLTGVAMIGGTWVGKTNIEKLPKETFRKFVGILLALVGLEMMIVG